MKRSLILLFLSISTSFFINATENFIEKETSGVPTEETVSVGGITYILWNNEAMIANGNSWEGKELVIPTEIEYEGNVYPVTRISWLAFHSDSLEKVFIPRTIHEIHHYAGAPFSNPFAYCSSLGEIEVDEANKWFCSVDNVLFSKDTTILCCAPAAMQGEYTVPASVKDIRGAAFSNCVYLTEICLPEGLTKIETSMFINCHGLESVKIPDGVASINAYVFDGCSSLKTLVIPGSVTYLSRDTFRFCHLSSLVLDCKLDWLSDNPLEKLDTSTVVYAYPSEIDVIKKVYKGTVLPIEEYEKTQTISSDKVWTMSYDSAYPGYPYETTYGKNILKGDTIMDGIKYMMCYKCTYNPKEDTEGELKPMWGLFGEQNEKVYMRFFSEDESILVMDYSLQAGDCFVNSRGNEFTVISTSDTIFKSSTDKTPRKCLYIARKGRQEVLDVWVKGIGSLFYGLLGIEGLQMYGAVHRLYRCVDGDEVLYDNSVLTGYFPDGTKWTEIRLDTLRFDSWYSKAGDEWVPNYETIEYYMKGKYTDKYGNTYQCVYTNGPEWTDSLTLMIQEADNSVRVSVLWHEDSRVLFPGTAYQFDWSVGKGLYYENILSSNTTGIESYYCYYGIIDEIKEGDFGGVRPLRYVDLDGKAPENTGSIIRIATNGGRIIQGIGITEWNDGECLFGPPCPYAALRRYEGYEQHPERHYRSMLVHFERNGEVLYDVWPEKGLVDGIQSVSKEKTTTGDTLFDLTGRRLTSVPARGMYIQNGKKKMVK